MFRLPVKKISNKKFPEFVLASLGPTWRVNKSSDHWVVEKIPESAPTEYFVDFREVSLIGEDPKIAIMGTLLDVEIPGEHEKLIAHSGTMNLELSVSPEFGRTSWLYAGKTMVYFASASEIRNEDEGFFKNMVDSYAIDEAIVYRKNVLPIFTMLLLRNHAYLLPQLGDNELPVISDETPFWGVVPHSMDFGKYIEPFLVFTPVIVAFPLDRQSSGIILLPKDTVVTPYEGNVSVAEIFLQGPSAPVSVGVFSIFGKANKFPKNVARSYVKSILGHANSFVDWLLNPSTCLSGPKLYDAGFGVQILASVNMIFSSFTFCARSIDPAERLGHIFGAFDRIANLSVSYSELKSGVKFGNSQVEEVERAKQLFSRLKFEKVTAIVRERFSERQAAEALIEAADQAQKDLLKSTAKFSGGIGEVLRNLRNTSHGAFLRKDKFLKQFSQSESKIDHKLAVVLYFYMLAFLIAPEDFLAIVAEPSLP